jgi:outer membrane protein OmpA-like peptidoglycan-associated protein
MIGIAKNLPGDEMERLILTNIAITDSDLKALAENRAIAARNWLIEHGEVPGERIFIVGAHEDKENDQKQGSRVEFLLR